MSHFHLAELLSKALLVGPGIPTPVSVLLVVTIEGSDCCKLLLKTAEEDR